MSVEVTLALIFPTAGGVELQEIARKHARSIPPPSERRPGDNEAASFLGALTDGRCVQSGPKGEMCSWSIIANYTTGEELIQALTLFLVGLFDERLECGLADHWRVIVMEQREDCGTIVYELRKDGVGIRAEKHGPLPFGWM